MKKLISLFLVLVMTLSLCACGKTEEAPDIQSQSLQVGFGRVEITPEMSVPLAGYGHTEKRMSMVARDPLYATCVALTDESGATLLLISQDLINSAWEQEARDAIYETTGVPTDHIMVAATHTHSGPDQRSPLECIQEYKKDYLKNVTEAAKAAMDDRCEGFVYTAKTKLEKMNGVRHYLMADGTYAGDNFGSFENNTVVEPAEAKDNDLQVIRFAREGKQDVVMVNWQAHPAKFGRASSGIMSADFVGDARTAFEQSSGALFVYFTGAAGNQNPSSKLVSECPAMEVDQYGYALAKAVIQLLETMDTPALATIQTKETTHTAKVNHDMEDKLEQAKEVSQVFAEKGGAEADALAKEYGLVGKYHADAIVRRSEYPQEMDITIGVATLGDISFVAAPYEMFSVHGTYIKENSPSEMTFVLSCCNGIKGYLPSVKAYDYNSYEAYNGNFARGTGDDLAKTFVEMLNALN